MTEKPSPNSLTWALIAMALFVMLLLALLRAAG